MKLAPVSLNWTIPHPLWGYSFTEKPTAEQGNGKLLPPAENGGREGNRPEEGTILFLVANW